MDDYAPADIIPTPSHPADLPTPTRSDLDSVVQLKTYSSTEPK